jgi:CheY-like chemotaxis protein
MREPRQDESTQAPANRPQRTRVVLAEDDEELRRMLGSALRRDGYDVSEARDGREALAVLRSALAFGSREPPIELVVSDVRMPGASGLDILAVARDMDPSLPVILMTAFDDGDVREQARWLGADAVFEKPFAPDDLSAVALHIAAPRPVDPS